MSWSSFQVQMKGHRNLWQVALFQKVQGWEDWELVSGRIVCVSPVEETQSELIILFQEVIYLLPAAERTVGSLDEEPRLVDVDILNLCWGVWLSFTFNFWEEFKWLIRERLDLMSWLQVKVKGKTGQHVSTISFSLCWSLVQRGHSDVSWPLSTTDL